ncbi:MAG TPA: outer membrane beta-barrel protein [Longimicrobium sp.]|nr:outer membrane beta-barrel protein [Longimicrobium sp.]
MKKAVFAAVAVALSVAAGEAKAQFSIPLSVEGRLDYAVPTGDFDDLADEGMSWGAGVALGITPGIGLYGTYSQTTFEVADFEDVDLEDNGFSVGLTGALPSVSGLSPWLGAGLVKHELAFDGDDGDEEANEGADEKLGFEVGGGLAIPVGANIRLTPAVGYRQYGVDVGALVGTSEFDVSYFTAGVGVNFSF